LTNPGDEAGKDGTGDLYGSARGEVAFGTAKTPWTERFLRVQWAPRGRKDVLAHRQTQMCQKGVAEAESERGSYKDKRGPGRGVFYPFERKSRSGSAYLTPRLRKISVGAWRTLVVPASLTATSLDQELYDKDDRFNRNSRAKERIIIFSRKGPAEGVQIPGRPHFQKSEV